MNKLFSLAVMALFTISSATLFVACDNENPVIWPDSEEEAAIFNENGTFTWVNGCGRIVYQSRIGADFDSALDSLMRRYEPILNVLAEEGHYSGEGVTIDKQKIIVDFSYDNREFTLLTFIDAADIYRILVACDVIDGKGNYYRLVPCED